MFRRVPRFVRPAFQVKAQFLPRQLSFFYRTFSSDLSDTLGEARKISTMDSFPADFIDRLERLSKEDQRHFISDLKPDDLLRLVETPCFLDLVERVLAPKEYGSFIEKVFNAQRERKMNVPARFGVSR